MGLLFLHTQHSTHSCKLGRCCSRCLCAVSNPACSFLPNPGLQPRSVPCTTLPPTQKRPPAAGQPKSTHRCAPTQPGPAPVPSAQQTLLPTSDVNDAHTPASPWISEVHCPIKDTMPIRSIGSPCCVLKTDIPTSLLTPVCCQLLHHLTQAYACFASLLLQLRTSQPRRKAAAHHTQQHTITGCSCPPPLCQQHDS